MRDMKTYTLFWKNEDTKLAQEADTNMWPWLLEEDGCTVAHGWGGDMIGAYRFQG